MDAWSIKTLNGLKKEMVRYWKERDQKFSVGRLPKGFSHPPKPLMRLAQRERELKGWSFGSVLSPTTLTIDGRKYRRIAEAEGFLSKPPTVEQALIALNRVQQGRDGTPPFEPQAYYRLFRIKAPEDLRTRKYLKSKGKDPKKEMRHYWKVILYRRRDQTGIPETFMS